MSDVEYLPYCEVQAKVNERLAVYYCEKGDHRQAARSFIVAAFHYELAGDTIAQARCEGQWEAEMKQTRRMAPVNVAALTD